MTAAGAAGGVLNAILSGNRFIWPARVTLNSRVRVVRPGLAMNGLIGACASVSALEVFTIGACPPGAPTPVSVTLPLAGALIAGLLAARWATNEVDKRLLRAAVSRACAAASADPEIVQQVEKAAPHDVCSLAGRLAPGKFAG
jgi:hypothetical protein